MVRGCCILCGNEQSFIIIHHYENEKTHKYLNAFDAKHDWTPAAFGNVMGQIQNF